MLSAKSSTLCVLLCLGFATANANTVFSKDVKYNKTTHLLRSVNIHDSWMTIVKSDVLPDDHSLRWYDVSHMALDSEGKSYSCRYVLTDDHAEIVAHPAGPGTVIILSVNKEGSKHPNEIEIDVVNIGDCRVYEADLEFESNHAAMKNLLENYNTISYTGDRTFDILYNDPKTCGDKVCKLGIDYEGKIVRGPDASFVPLAGSTTRLVKKASSSSNFIVTEVRLDGTYRISLVKPDGQAILKEFKSYGELKDHDVSNSHGVLRICSQTNTTKVDCEEFDDSGKTTSKFSVTAPHRVELVTVENLANGVFLLLSESEETGAAIMKVKGDGSVVGIAKLPDFARDDSTDYESYIDVKDDQYCVTRRFAGNENLKVTRDCIGDNDFH